MQLNIQNQFTINKFLNLIIAFREMYGKAIKKTIVYFVQIIVQVQEFFFCMEVSHSVRPPSLPKNWTSFMNNL